MLSFLRLTDMLFFYPQQHSNWLFNTLWMGLRFDALILSFVLLISLSISKVSRVLFAGFWFFIILLNFLNSLGLGLRGEHLWRQNIENFHDLWGSGFWGHKILVLGVSIFVYFLGVRLYKNLNQVYQSKKWQLKFPYILVLLVLARGSLGHDHLRRNHCDGRPHKTIRSFCMNPAYTFLKSRNQEFP
jgi:hypothetical protein